MYNIDEYSGIVINILSKGVSQKTTVILRKENLISSQIHFMYRNGP